jgi:hypothetical protein
VAAAATEALSPKLRDTLLLAQGGEHDYAAIGMLLKIPVGTVKWRVSEARKNDRRAGRRRPGHVSAAATADHPARGESGHYAEADADRG